ncbi:hypothetical protein K470DRAFT_256708 [Piedraia hortae CBS 480.64]|uniref:rRNA-processing protein FYV7 n=1 Tax=Piedraia hortae CBS 480.64 TaxID=1314780 RepID=A0A6A7C242_9PEZI|nr:hypothetical protein K470DRAFT_256708 [Piedraia hortae CBS 480.64]
MAEKRPRDNVPDYRPGKKKQKRKGGFQVGPANLPDGAYKRKNQKIKETLIGKAKVKKEYRQSLKKYAVAHDERDRIPIPASMREEMQKPEVESAQESEAVTTAPHPDRQALMDQREYPNQISTEDDQTGEKPARQRKQRPPKTTPFKREREEGLKRKAEAEERRRLQDEERKQRQAKAEQRERFRRQMAKARAVGPNGQRRLGRESGVLLEKIKQLVDK